MDGALVGAAGPWVAKSHFSGQLWG